MIFVRLDLQPDSLRVERLNRARISLSARTTTGLITRVTQFVEVNVLVEGKKLAEREESYDSRVVYAKTWVNFGICLVRNSVRTVI